jgi:hypothetical protein
MDQPISADSAAVVIDIYDELTIEVLQSSYQRISLAKKLKKTPVQKGDDRTNVTMGIVFAARASASLETIGEELDRLNRSTPSHFWPDMVVVGAIGTISYGVQFPGEGVSGSFLPPAQGATANYCPAIYVVPLMTPTGALGFNKMLAFVLPHLGIFASAAIRNLPNYEEILQNVPKNAVTLGGYQFDLSGALAVVPREHYNDRYLAPRPLLIVDNRGRALASVQYLPWQDGAVILLRGKLPLEGLLILLGKDALKKGGVIRRPDSQISHVLPITPQDFNDLLVRFQRQSNMRVKEDPGHFVIQKLADEGASSPFMARIFLNILRLREQVYTNPEKRDHFDKLFDYMSSALSTARASSQEIDRILKEHTRKISSGEIVQFDGQNVRISESIDKELKAEIEAFLNAAARALKTGMQDIGKELGVNIGFLFQKPDSFERGHVQMRKKDADLADYIQRTREWSEPLMKARNDLEHSTAVLPRIEYHPAGRTLTVREPHLQGKPIAEFVNHILDRLCCFVEEFACHCLRKLMPEGITVTEIPLANRPREIPERFQVTLAQGGLPPWRIAYHQSKFEET